MNALKETSKALKQYGRTVDVASIDHLLNNLEVMRTTVLLLFYIIWVLGRHGFCRGPQQ